MAMGTESLLRLGSDGLAVVIRSRRLESQKERKEVMCVLEVSKITASSLGVRNRTGREWRKERPLRRGEEQARSRRFRGHRRIGITWLTLLRGVTLWRSE